MLISIIKRNPLLYNLSRFVVSKSGLARRISESYLKNYRLHQMESYISEALRFIKKDVTAEQAALVKETLRLVLECGQFTADDVDDHIGLRGKRILEVGCGHCWYAPFFLGRGAISYTGIDPFRDFEDHRIYNYNQFSAQNWQDAYKRAEMSLREFIGSFENIYLYNEDILTTILPESSFDGIFLLSVSEHFKRPKEAFKKISDLLVPGGKLFIAHHNYYSWAGHHQAPKFVSEYDPGDEKMRFVADWNHLLSFIPNDGSDMDYLNFIRIHELIEIVQSMFHIEQCLFDESKEETGRSRLTDDIIRHFPQYSKKDLLTDMVHILCTKPAAE